MKSGLVYLRPSRLAYVRVTGPYETSAPEAWERMTSWIAKNGFDATVTRGYGMMRDNPKLIAAENCRYDACVDLNPLFEERAIRELGAQTLPGGSYVRLRKSGKYQAIRAEVAGFYTEFDAPNGLRLDDRRPMVMIFLDNPRQFAVEDVRADICVPVSATAKRSPGDDLEAA